MEIVIGPVLMHADGYRFDTSTAGKGMTRGHPYRRMTAVAVTSAFARVTCPRSVSLLIASTEVKVFSPMATASSPERKSSRSAGFR